MCVYLPVEVAVLFEVVDECQHLLLVSECQERDEAHQSLQHAGAGAHERAVDAIQQHHQLLAVAAQLRELLKQQPAVSTPHQQNGTHLKFGSLP